MDSKITLYLMTQKGYEVLLSLVTKKYFTNISIVIVGRDRLLENDYAEEIISLCLLNGILYQERYEPVLVSTEYSLLISWRWLVPTGFSKLIVMHDSLLPKYRGFSPLVNSLINGEREIGVTAVFASEHFDRGDIIDQVSCTVDYPIKISEAIKLISDLYVKLTLSLFCQINQRKIIKSMPQDSLLATYSLWRDENDYFIDWSKSSTRIQREIHALSYPYRGAMAYIGSQKIIILDAEIERDVVVENRDVGKCLFKIGEFPIIVCGEGLLKITNAFDESSGEKLAFEKFRIRLTMNRVT